MAFDPIESLRAAGILSGPVQPAHEKFYRSLTQEETSVLISLKDRLPSFLPEVQAHAADWASPEAVGAGFTADCACGLWSGSGSVAK